MIQNSLVRIDFSLRREVFFVVIGAIIGAIAMVVPITSFYTNLGLPYYLTWMAFGHVIGVYSSSIIAGVVIHMITAISIGVAVGVFLYKTSILNISKLSNGLLYGLLVGSIVFIVLGEMWTESIRMANLNGAKWRCEGERNIRRTLVRLW